jgi:predicted NBD/HSP70 family sugar kinase
MVTTPRPGSKSLIRDLNRSLVFNLIADHGPISRIELARKAKLTAATIGTIVENFLAARLVLESDALETARGRPQIYLRINPKAGFMVGVKLREFQMTVVICDMACSVLTSRTVVMEKGITPHQALPLIVDAIEESITAIKIPRDHVLGVGIGVSGSVDAQQGLLRYSNHLNWRNVELGAILEYKLRIPVSVDNDVNTLAVAERHFGVARDASNCLLLTIGRGIGLSLVLNGEVYRGTYGGTSGFGHMTIDINPDAPLCTCGKRGCLEAIASDYGIAHAALGTPVGFSDEETMIALLQQALAGDERIRAIFTHAAQALGIGLANIMNIFDPSLVLLGGEGLRAESLLLDTMRETIPQHLFGDTRPDVPFVICSTDDIGWARGAASIVLREVFRPPLYETNRNLPIDILLNRKHSSL